MKSDSILSRRRHHAPPMEGEDPVKGSRAATSLAGTMAVSLTVVLASGASAHVGQIVYPIYELPTFDLPDLHDGTLEDWEAVLPGASLDQRDFGVSVLDGAEGGNRPVAEKIAFEVYLAWHYASQRIFVGVNRYDAYYRYRLPPEPPAIRPVANEDLLTACCGYYDRVEVFVDGDHGGERCTRSGGSLESRREIDNVECQAYQVVPEADGERRIRMWGFGPMWALDSPYTDAAGFRVGESPSLSGYEVAVTPWDELQDDLSGSVRSRMEPEHVVGFCIGIWDADDFINWPEWLQDQTLPNPWSIYLSSGCHHHFGDQFLDGLLIPCAVGDCSHGPSPTPSSVRVDSWGRVKASFR